jgi:hypothetical protein
MTATPEQQAMCVGQIQQTLAAVKAAKKETT